MLVPIGLDTYIQHKCLLHRPPKRIGDIDKTRLHRRYLPFLYVLQVSPDHLKRHT